jgi:putative heme-binding domain-containing protein
MCLAIWSAQGRPGASGPIERPYGLTTRTPWTASHITGSPEPPRPYKIARAFPKLAFKNPLLITSAPGTDRLFVGEQAGKLFSFPDRQDVARADLVLDLTKELHSWDSARVRGIDALYGLAFHPQFTRNRYCYVCYVLASTKPTEQLPDGSRVSRFRVTNTDPPRIDPKSEKVLMTWMAGGHNGGCLQFGRDGFLYISTGDAADPNPPDRFDTGQDISDLLSSILRIDVDHEDKGKAYAVPPDNPFVQTPGARPEVWAYGFRNPWRMGFDRATGDLWVGDVGWELWEMIYHVRRGGNYGWSVMEGPQPVRPDSRRGPTPILPPALAFPHSEAASITGGYVYRGKRLKELVGAYLCGDWMTRKIWGTRFDAQDKITWHQELAQGTEKIVAFGETNGGEVYFLHHDDVGSVLQLVPNEAANQHQAPFPQKLSETGLFASVKDHQPAPGVLPFSVNAEQWLDHGTAERLVGVPGDSAIRIYDELIRVPGTAYFTARVFFPKDGVLARTISLEMERGNPQSRRRLETQILHFDGDDWRGYTYQWNDEQTDAVLVPATGADRTFTVRDAKAPGGKRRQTWHFPARAECVRCHNPWAGYLLAFVAPQLNRDHAYGPIMDNQLRALEHIGVITALNQQDEKDRPGWRKPPDRLANPCDPTANLNERARAYLHVNCSHCHQFGAGGTTDFDLRYTMPLDQTKTVNIRPVQGTFDIPDVKIVAPADPYHSVLYYRMAKLGRGRMPHIGSEFVDEQGLRLIHDWIRRLPLYSNEQALLERLRALDEATAVAKDEQEAADNIKKSAEQLASAAGHQGITLEDRQKAEIEWKAQASTRLQARAAERTEVINRLLSSASGALLLLHAFDEHQISELICAQVVKAATTRPDPTVRDLFERFLPDDQRVKRLGTTIRPEQILTLKGDTARGKELFLKMAGLQCVNCHRINGVGNNVGPDLSHIASKSNRAQILESILEPSKVIDPKYATYVVALTDGQVQTGVLAEKNEKEIVLKNAGDKETRIPAGKVEAMAPQKTSLMPDQLLRDLTAEQAADLLEFLAALK